MVDLKQRRDCYRGDDCRNIFDRRAVKIGAILQVPVPSSSRGMLAIGSFAPGRFYRCLSPGVCRQTVDALLTHQNHHRLAADGYQSAADGHGSAPPPLEPLMSKLRVLTLQP
jgi:hypothetical protein